MDGYPYRLFHYIDAMVKHTVLSIICVMMNYGARTFSTSVI